jgi:hypothetical protein
MTHEQFLDISVVQVDWDFKIAEIDAEVQLKAQKDEINKAKGGG